MKQKTKKLSANYMDLVFIQNKDRPWTQKENGIVEIKMENKGFFNTIAQKFFKRPRFSNIALDAYGSKLWLCIDGNNTVSDILKKMEEAFSTEKDTMLKRVVQFLTTLEAHSFITRKK